MSKRDEQDPPEPAARPTPYPIEEALEAAYAPEPFDLPPHTDDREQESESGWVSKPPPEALCIARAGSDLEAEPRLPETLLARLEPLPRPWMIQFVLALYENGGEPALVCRRQNISMRSVAKWAAKVPEFAEAINEAEICATGLLKGDLYRAATIGDLQGVWHQGVRVGFERRRSVKAAELILRARGELGQPDAGSRSDSRGAPLVPQVADADIPAIVSGVVERLFSGRKGRPVVVEAETVPQKEP